MTEGYFINRQRTSRNTSPPQTASTRKDRHVPSLEVGRREVLPFDGKQRLNQEQHEKETTHS